MATCSLPGHSVPEEALPGIVARVADGDESALRELYDALAPRVLGLAQQILRDRDVAEEATVAARVRSGAACAGVRASGS